MDSLELALQIIVHTPVWVYLIFAYLVFQGIRARRPADISPYRLIVLPVLLTLWGIWDLVSVFGIRPANLTTWLVALIIGVMGGMAFYQRLKLSAGARVGVIHREADFTLLPLLLFTFGVKYIFAVMLAIAPTLAHGLPCQLPNVAFSGFFAGVFIGKSSIYMQAYRAIWAK
ncbi:DUF6622 family protein [Edaphovirga cremea]|uniref:DUF6622 family protein n=1 Tax=Edaphovirga cremea TaxID=2267246 RepID=UPI0039898735